MESPSDRPKRNGCLKFLGEYWALFIKMLVLTKRKRVQTIVEILLAYIFLALLLGMRYLLDRNYFEARTLPPFRPFDSVTTNSTTANRTFYYPNNTCAQTIATTAMNNLQTNVPGLSFTIGVIPDATLATLSNSTLQSIYAYIYFTNLDGCTNVASMPDEVEYTLRLQENGLTYYRPQRVKIEQEDYLWKRSPEDYCRDNSTTLNYTTQFLGVQYFVDLAIIRYVTSVTPDVSSVYLNHFGCPEVYLDNLHTTFTFFVPLFYSIIYVVTFLLNLGYIVEERANKTKEYLRIFGLRTWVNNFVWITRSMFIYLILTCVCTGLSIVVMKSSESKWNSVSKAVFNFSHWTLIWTILFVYSIQVSVFTVFFGQFFRRALLAKLVGFIIWIITFIDFYDKTPAGVRYFLCLFPNIGLLSCIQILQQFERRSSGMATFEHLYTNIFDYPLYIGICLLLMLIYSVIYFFLAIYVERLNPGEFGVSQPWNYIFKKSYWKTAKIQPLNTDLRSEKEPNRMANTNHWIELNHIDKKPTPAMTIDHLNKKFGKFQAVTNLTLEFYEGEVCTLLGHNGAGKTTTTFILVGMLEPTSGRVTIQGFDNQLQIEKVRHYLGFCPQYDILYDDLSVEEHLELVAKMRHMDKDRMKESIEVILDLIGLKNDRNNLSKNLSGGMKRRLSIGISLVNDPKVIILDEPTSGIDPYNRRLVWAIIKKLKMSGKCVLLTTHFLEEADVLSDRIAIMSRGRLQANGTPDFLKQQTEFEYRLLIDRQEHLPTDGISTFVQGYIPNIVLERESAAELIYGIKRGESKQIERLISGLDQNKQSVGINSYGLSMTTIEDVFLRLVQEEEEHESKHHHLDDKVFRKQYDRVTGRRLFFERIRALLIKRWHVSRRQISLFFGFFFLSILLEILAVAVIPTPQEIQSSMTLNDRTTDAKITFQPSMYNPQTIVSYANSDTNLVQTRLTNYLAATGATIDSITTDTVDSYVRNRYHETEDIFVNKYQISFAGYDNSSGGTNAMRMNAYFSTVNYHAMPTSLTAASTNLFQFYANSSRKNIRTTNHPILTPRIGGSYISEVLAVFYCFEIFPITLFAFFNGIIAIIFMGVLLLPMVAERLNNSKDLQILTNLSRKTYWISNWIYDVCLCLILISLLTIIVKVGAETTSKTDAEYYVFRNNTAAGYFFLMLFMYVLASLPFAYVFSFLSKSTIMAFTNFFILNVIVSIIDAIISSFPVFSQNPNPENGPTSSYRTINVIRTIFAIGLPSVNLKHAIANLVLHDNAQCIRISNSILGTKFVVNENFLATSRPGVGTEFVLFIVQTIFWTIILIVIERRSRTTLCCSSQDEDIDESNHWKDGHLDEDVRRERQMILHNDSSISSAVIIVKDLIKKFKKKSKTKDDQIYYAVNHVNFHVQKRACFGLLGANGAGKTTTFRMLVNDIKPSSGQIIINGKNINTMARDLEIGFCPQFDWLVYDLSVLETLYLFARLKGVESSEIAEMCENIMAIFGLEMYEKRVVQKLSGGNKRKVSSALAFMANPALVFLDEPTTGLDAAAKRKLWKVIRAARDVGLTIIMTSHSMEECEALCTKIGIMKTGQFMCLGTLQRLRNRFGHGYTVQVKVAGENVENVKMNLLQSIPGLEVQDQHNEVLFCNVPYVSTNSSFNLAHVFETLNQRKEQNLIESYSVTQSSLEQIFVQLAGEDEEQIKERVKQNHDQAESQPVITRF